jgi:hypothetical protein
MRLSVILLCFVAAAAPWLRIAAAELPDSLAAKHGARFTWDFENGNEGWANSNSISSLHAADGSLRGWANGADPHVFNPNMKLAIKGSAGVAVRVWFSSSAPLQLYWANEDGDYSEARQVNTTVPANQWTTVWFDLANHPEWAAKTLSKIRLDPGDSGVAFVIEHVSILDEFSTPDLPYVSGVLDFSSGLEGWTQWDVADFRGQDGKLMGRSSGGDPHVVSGAMSYADQGGVMAHIKSSHPCDVKLFWATTEGGFSEERSINLPVDGNGYWQVLTYDLRNHPAWAGKTITRLRLDPGLFADIRFEIDSITVLTPEAFADADGDRLTAVEEAIYRTDPNERDSIPYRLTEEKWSGLSFYSTSTLVSGAAFYAKPGTYGYGRLESGHFFGNPNSPNYFATRHRGYLTAPATGYYRFWISGRSGVELHLSTDSSKYRKQLIARLNPEISTGYGVDRGSTNFWDVYGSQMSRNIYLEAGQKYYLEAIQTTGHMGGSHLGIAWAQPGKGRQVLATDNLESYYPTTDDADDDYLPDAWEAQYGLNPLDNGQIDMIRQGERGDFDGDGLTNREEYLLGTDPSNSDTDGDGETDGDEVNALGSNALVANAITDTFLSEVNLGSFTSSSTAWTMTSGGLLADGFRGEATWDFSIPTDGNWLFRLELELMGVTYGNEEVPIVVKVNGKTVVRKQVRFGSGKHGLLQALTPWLLAGNHHITVLVDNSLARRTVRLVSLKIFAPSNPAAMLAQENRVLSHPAASRSSPAFIEGYARDPGSVTLNGVPAENGTGGGHWFANVPLANVPDTQPYTLHYEEGWEASGTLIWQATNVMDGETLTIRQGDALRVGAWGADPAMPSTVTLSSGGSTHLTGQATTQLLFPTAGVFTVGGILQNGASATLTVNVIAPPGFSADTVDALENAVRTLSVFAAPEVAFDTQEDLCRLFVNRTGTAASVGIMPARTEESGVAARLFAGGPILAVQRVNVIGLSDALQNDLTSASSANLPGYKLLQSPLTVLNLPPGARVDVSIFRAGVMFPNGTTLRSVYLTDLTNGSAILKFLFPLGQPGGYCHHLLVYDRNGVYLGTR